MRVDVVGGSYREECDFPSRSVLRGSGGRAAALLSSLGVETVLHTVVPHDESSLAEQLAKTFRYQLVPTKSDQAVRFHYPFPLGRPDIAPQPVRAVNQPLVRAERALVFGMLEGRPRVEAERVVYDPQDGRHSRHFSDNQSSAGSLAYVVSLLEGCVLTGRTDPMDIVNDLLHRRDGEVAVVKCGPQGAVVGTLRDRCWIRAFPSAYVYKIGSGDIFSAAFAYAWMCQDIDPVEAAWFASRCVAHYVEQVSERFNHSEIRNALDEARRYRSEHVESTPRSIPQKHIYLAAPFFNVGQRWVVEETRNALMAMGFKVFSPIHDVGFGRAREVATADLEALGEAGVVLAILDGLDAGTLFEVGHAVAQEIRVIAVAENVPKGALTMLEGSGCDIVPDLTTGIYRTCWALMGDV